MVMPSPESFDAFYASTRERLLLEAYALTGDVSASRTAVRDAFAVAWHHWRKVAALDDREAWVRPLAHGRAQRRHTARPWHRDKTLDDDVRRTLAALSDLTGVQRRTLVLTTLSPLSMGEIARTVGVPRAVAERELQTATARFSLSRDVPSTEIRTRLEELRGPLRDVRWPRATIVRRAGAARRRTHTVTGVGLAGATLLLAGAVVASGEGASSTSLAEGQVSPGVTVHPVSEQEPAAALDDAVLLTGEQVVRLDRGLDWTETGTSTAEEGRAGPCQLGPFAGPAPVDTRLRTFEGTREVRRTGKGGREKRVTETTAVASELVELAADPDAARVAYSTSRAWFAACADPRTQLMSTRTLRRVGDEAALFGLRSWRKEQATLWAGVARTGSVTVTTLVRSSRPVAAEDAALALAASVNALCGSPGAATCAGPPRTKVTDPLTVGDPPGLLSVVDLPPVTGARGPWVGTDPARARDNYAATRCDRTEFRGPGLRGALTRTFLFPQTRRAGEFGLTQTAATASTRRARGFVEEVRRRIRECADAGLGTSVTTVAQRGGKRQELTAWNLEMEISDSRSARFLMAILRDGGRVAQIGFTPSERMTMSAADFRALADRALQRLSDMKARG